MASSQAGPAFQLKHRIVGALILVSVGIVALPLILGSPNPDLISDVPDQPPAPETDTKVFVSKITPIGGATPVIETSRARVPASTAVPAGETAKPPQASAPKASPPPAKPAAKRSTEAAKKPTAVAAAKTVPDRGWVVQVGTFGNADNVKRVIKDLRAQGFSPSSTSVRTKSGPATRIWVGPYAQRVDAARVRARIQQSLGTKGLITSYP
jgi:DedD protein